MKKKSQKPVRFDLSTQFSRIHSGYHLERSSFKIILLVVEKMYCVLKKYCCCCLCMKIEPPLLHCLLFVHLFTHYILLPLLKYTFATIFRISSTHQVRQDIIRRNYLQIEMVLFDMFFIAHPAGMVRTCYVAST